MKRRPVRTYAGVATVLWNGIVLASLAWNLHEQQAQTLKVAKVQGEAIADMDISFRNWIIDNGGVYVPAAPESPADKVLRSPEKDVRTPSGRKLTFFSHADAMQQLYKNREQLGTISGHITSLKHRNPDGTPDEWERTALAGFDQGESDTATSSDGRYLRFIRAFRMEKRCSACHADGEARIGAPLGGVTNEIPLAPLEAASRTARVVLILGHALIWAMGLLGIGFASWRLDRDMTLIRSSEERYRSLFDSSQDALMTLAPPSWAFTSGNPATIALFKARDEADFSSHGPWELSPERQPDGRPSADKAREMIETAMRTGSHSFPWTHKRLDGTEFPAEVLLTRMESAGKTFLQATVRDITARKLEEAEREALIAKLRDALAHVKTLSGFIPICASCKKIRNDKGFWESLEKYLAQHSDAQLSHGICPDCGKKLYGDLYDQENPTLPPDLPGGDQ